MDEKSDYIISEGHFEDIYSDINNVICNLEKEYGSDSDLWNNGNNIIEKLVLKKMNYLNIIPGSITVECRYILMVIIGKDDDINNRIESAYNHLKTCKKTRHVIFLVTKWDSLIWKENSHQFKNAKVYLRFFHFDKKFELDISNIVSNYYNNYKKNNLTNDQIKKSNDINYFLGHQITYNKNNSKPIGMRLGNKEYNIKYVYEILVNTANWLIDQGKVFNYPIQSGTRLNNNRYLLNIKGYHKDGKPFTSPRKLNNNCILETHYSRKDIIENAKRLLEKFGYKKDILNIIYDNKQENNRNVQKESEEVPEEVYEPEEETVREKIKIGARFKLW